MLESERFRSQVSKGQHARAGFPIPISGTCKRRWSFWLCYSPNRNNLVIEILWSREGKLDDQVPSRCKNHIYDEGSCFLHEWGGYQEGPLENCAGSHIFLQLWAVRVWQWLRSALTCSGKGKLPSGGFSPALPFTEGVEELTEGLPLALRRKLAVWAAAGGWLGIGRWPSAIPTIAVMWVSVPKTWMGIPVVFPACTHKNSQLWGRRGRNKTSFSQSKVFNLEKAQQEAGGRYKRQEPNWRKRVVLTHFSHDTQSFLVVRASSSHKDPHLMLFQRALVILNCSHDALKETKTNIWYRWAGQPSVYHALPIISTAGRDAPPAPRQPGENSLGLLTGGSCCYFWIVTYLKSGCDVREVGNAASNDQDFTWGKKQA